MPGYRSPVCVRCGTPNPRPLSEAEWDELLQLRADPQLRRLVSVWEPARPSYTAALDARRTT